MVIEREYGQATTVLFPLVVAGGTNFQTTWTPAAGETQLSKDEAAFANASNTPVHQGNGVWSLALTATEMQAARIVLTLSDGATDIEDQAVLIETYGNASAEHAWNRNSDALQSDWADGGRLDAILDNVLTEAQEKQRPEKGAALSFPFTMVDTNGQYVTALSVTVEISKNGGAFAAATNAVSEVSDGLYTIELTATEMNADEVVVKCTAVGAEAVIFVIFTQDA